ncbi:latent-transforming growth factor beta-binding protein 1-like [Parasteatoda tepidariorum]|uniref:latent-transforming growth factor beta-binding protein 1-like n=1 Tax=Parasteatoda tepidariorum TaxID=114398 RepID=UPI0039BCF65E
MSRERFVKLFCFLLLSFTFNFTHTKAEEKDFELSNAFRDVENHGAISADVCNSTKDCNFLGQCINIAGENICDCYYNGLSGKNCEIIDECFQNSGMCGADGDADCSFHMMKKKAYCKCKEEGQRFDEPTKKCVPQKKCTNHKECHNGAVCEEREGDEKYCSCEYGTSGDFCDIIQECVDNPNLCGDAECRYNTLLRRAFCYCDDINQRFDWSSKSCVNRKQSFSKEGLILEIATLSSVSTFKRDLYFVFKETTAENPVSQR